MEPNYHTAAYVVKDLIQNYDLSIIDPTLVLNVNTPNVDYSNELEINITTIGSWGPRNPPGVEEDSENKISYWTTHRESFEEDNTKCDINSLKENKISISPIKPVFSLTQDVLNNFELKIMNIQKNHLQGKGMTSLRTRQRLIERLTKKAYLTLEY